MPLRHRRGFTVTELVVAIAIVAILMALLVPAVQKVRAAMIRAHCANNLRQMALAMHQFHDQQGRFPQGGGDPGGENPASRPFFFSWTFHLYPYLEQEQLFNLVPGDPLGNIQALPTGKAILAELDRTPVALYYCPARREVQLYHGVAVCDYAGNQGMGEADGVIVPNDTIHFTGIRLATITDGASSTLLLGERRVNLATLASGSDTCDNESCVRPGADCDVLRRAQPKSGSWLIPAEDFSKPTMNNYFGGGHFYQFGSSHEAGMQAALCDGSVRLISYQIDPLVFRSLCVRDDGQGNRITLGKKSEVISWSHRGL